MNCKYCGEAIIPCPKQPCGLGEYLHGESGLHRCNQGLTATPVPVAPAPTASATTTPLGYALGWVMANRQFVEHMISIEESEDIPDLVKALSAYASSQSEKLAGVGQQAAEEIRARYLESIAAGVKHPGADWLEVISKGIIDRVIAGRVKP